MIFRAVEDTDLIRKARRGDVEAFNLLNHPIYGNPASNVSSASFGVITTQLNDGATGTGTSRRMQLMLRLAF